MRPRPLAFSRATKCKGPQAEVLYEETSPRQVALCDGRDTRGSLMPNRIIASLAVVTVIITTALFTAVSASAVTTTYTQTQLSPGVQQRAIWGELQVAQYKINVTHTGYIHYEATFKPYWNYVSVFLIDKDLNVVNKVQGLYPVDVGKTVIDFKVDAISAAGAALVDPDTVADSGDEYLVGDDYTLVVQSYLGDDTKFKIWGYSP